MTTGANIGPVLLRCTVAHWAADQLVTVGMVVVAGGPAVVAQFHEPLVSSSSG
jgi:hypothetical protein